MSNSSLISYTKISPNQSGPRSHVIDTVSIHCMAGPLSVETCGEIFQHSAASSNYGIGPDGRIAMYVEEGHRSWCSSNADNDDRAVTIEVASNPEPPYKVTEAAYKSLILLLIDICQRNGIKELLWKADKRLIGQVDKQNMTVHKWFSSKDCPGEFLYKRHSKIAEEVNSKLSSALYDIAEGKSSAFTVSSGNSSLANYVDRISASNYKTRAVPVNRITVHTARTVGDIYALSLLLNSSDKSYNYGIDSYGTIGLFVDECMWTKSSDNDFNDSQSINIICMNSALAPDYTISDECYESLVRLCEDVCRRNFIFELKHVGDPFTDTLTLHKDFNPASDCPGPFLESRVYDLSSRVTDAVGAKFGSNMVEVSARLADNETEALKSQSTIAIKSIKPYIVRPSVDKLNVNYNALKEFGVVGAMLNAGERFNPKHEVVSYRSENVYKQTLEVKAANLPHGYFYTTRARTAEEVREEAYWFYYVLSKYPPKLGVWLHCQFDSDISSSDAELFVQKWYEFFVDWGLKSKCGIYANRTQAGKIGWPNQCAYMPLWLEGDLTDSVCPDEELLTPSFFKLGQIEAETPATQSSGTAERYQGSSGSTKSDKPAKAEKVQTGTSTDVIIPYNPKYTGFKSYSGYKTITNKQSKQYQINFDDSVVTDSKGFRVIDGNFLVVVGSGICNTIGTYMDVILDNGTVIPAIMGDAKSDTRTDSEYHIFSDQSTYCCCGFIVDNQSGVLDDTVRRMGDCSYRQPDWEGKVIRIKVKSDNWFTQRGN